MYALFTIIQLRTYVAIYVYILPLSLQSEDRFLIFNKMLASNMVVFAISIQAWFIGDHYFKLQFIQGLCLLLNQMYTTLDLEYIKSNPYKIALHLIASMVVLTSIVTMLKLLHNIELKFKFEELKIY